MNIEKYFKLPFQGTFRYFSYLNELQGALMLEKKSLQLVSTLLEEFGYPPIFHGGKIKIHRSFPVKPVFYVEFN